MLYIPTVFTIYCLWSVTHALCSKQEYIFWYPCPVYPIRREDSGQYRILLSAAASDKYCSTIIAICKTDRKLKNDANANSSIKVRSDQMVTVIKSVSYFGLWCPSYFVFSLAVSMLTTQIVTWKCKYVLWNGEKSCNGMELWISMATRQPYMQCTGRACARIPF